MADGDGAQGDLLNGDKGGAAAGGAGSEGTGAAAGAAAGAGAAAAGTGAAAAAGGDDAGKAAAEAARVAAQTPEQKAAEAKVAADKTAADKAAADAKAKGDAPADYTALKMPDGYKTDPADPVFGEALKLFGDNKIAPDVAQKLLDFTVTRDQAMAKAVNDGNVTSWAKQADGWKAETAKKFSAEDLGIAKTAFEKVFDAETAKYLEGLRYTDHPGVVAAMVKIGKAIKDDTFVAGNAGANGAGSDARKFFPNTPGMNP
jgi:hypothetical protein